jgi:hypothetical protein
MPLYLPGRGSLPAPAAGQYMLPLSQGSASTSVTLGNGTLRLGPWVLERTLTIDRIGGEITAAGEAGSVLRLGIYSDNGNAYPNALLLDGGTIDGTSATTQVATVSLTLAPGLYWIGGAVQAAPSSQPTVRIASNPTIPLALGLGTGLPGASTSAVGFSQTSVTGALPSTFSASVSSTGSVPRLLVRAA